MTLRPSSSGLASVTSSFAGPLYGDLAAGLCTEHVLTRSVRDSAALLDAVHGPSPGDPYRARHLVQTVFGAGVGWVIGRWRRRLGRPPADGEIEPQTQAYWERANAIGAAEYLFAAEALQRISRRVAVWFQTYDAWLTPAVGTAPPPLGELVGTADDPLRGRATPGGT